MINQTNQPAKHRKDNNKAASESHWKKWGAIIVGAVTFLAAVAEFSGYSLSDLCTNGGNASKNQTNIMVKDSAKVEAIITGDSNTININSK